MEDDGERKKVGAPGRPRNNVVGGLKELNKTTEHYAETQPQSATDDDGDDARHHELLYWLLSTKTPTSRGCVDAFRKAPGLPTKNTRCFTHRQLHLLQLS